MSLFFRKSIAELRGEADAGTLKRALSAVDLTALGVGAIIGAGIFVLAGQAAAQYAGPAVVLSFVIAGLACAFAGLCYAEFASMIPVAGSAYTYSYATMGELIAWIIGWDLVLEYALACSTVAVGWSGYVTSFLRDWGIHIPAQFAAATGTTVTLADGSAATAIVNIPAVLIILLISSVLIMGIRQSAGANAAIVLIKTAVILLFIGFGAGYVIPEHWRPFIPANTGTFGEFGWSGILRGAGVVFFAYIGFDAVSTAAQEAKNPQRNMPIGILTSLVICTILYIAVALVLTGIVPFSKLNVPDPMAVGIDATGLVWLAPFIKLGAIAGLSSVILVQLLGQSRIFYTMSRDGLLPPVFGKIHPRLKTPHLTTMITGGAVAVAAGTLPIHILAEMVSIGTLLAFAIVCGGVLVMRYRQPELERPFKTPFMPWVPILGMGSCVYLMTSLSGATWLRLLIWLLIGTVIYFVYGRRRAARVRAERAELVHR
jgi:APA family basic amino acid/polyamine antiporter